MNTLLFAYFMLFHSLLTYQSGCFPLAPKALARVECWPRSAIGEQHHSVTLPTAKTMGGM